MLIQHIDVPKLTIEEKAEGWTANVMAAAERFLSMQAKTKPQHRLLKKAFEGLQEQVKDWMPEEPGRTPLIPFIHLPILVYAGVKGKTDEKALQLAAATSLLFLGIDCFDDVADNDCPSFWGETSVAERNLVAATLLSSLPQLLVTQIAAPAAVLIALVHKMSEGLLRMSAGQQSDLLSGSTSHLHMKDALATISAKSGAELAMFAGMAARLADADKEQIAAYEKFGHAIGTASQLSSDCYDLFTDPACRDLRHGTRTLPIVIYLNSLPDDARSDFTILLERAKKDTLAQTEVKEKIKKSATMGACALIVENFCTEAKTALKEAGPSAMAATGLQIMINDLRFFKQ